MGGFMSHPVDVESAYPESEGYNRIPRFQDPRSPSMEINRTPITVYDPINKILDPRSPSEGIDRTPIAYQLPQKYRKSIRNGSSQLTDAIPPLCLEDSTEASPTKDANPLSQSLIEIDSCDENKNDSHSESETKDLDEKVVRIPVGISEEMMPSPILPSPILPSPILPSPILPLIPNEHVIETPSMAPLTSTTIDITTTTNTGTVTTSTTATTKFTNVGITKSKIPTAQITKKAPTLPFTIPVDNPDKKSDFLPVKGFGWKKSGGCVFPAKTDSEGRSPLLSRNGDNKNLAFSPIQANTLSKIQPSFRQIPLRARNKNAEVEKVPMTDTHNKENVTILWEN